MSGPEDVKVMWYEHFSQILNISSHAVQTEGPGWDALLTSGHRAGSLPTFSELVETLTLSKLQRGKDRHPVRVATIEWLCRAA